MIFQATSSGRGNVVSLSKANTDTTLYKSYATNDLRKKVFFKAGGTGNELFKGDYAAGTWCDIILRNSHRWNVFGQGWSFARNNNITSGLADLNTLLATRWQKGTYVPYTSSLTQQSLLTLILTERRKELLFRNEIRWNDLRRLKLGNAISKNADEKTAEGKHGKIVADYGVEGIPTKFIIDGNGNIRFKKIGWDGSTESLADEVATMIDLIANAATTPGKSKTSDWLRK